MATIPIIKLLVVAAKATASVTSPADKGAYKISTMFPCIFPIIKDEEEWEKACWIICIAINPGARKVIKGKPSISDLPPPIATARTIRKSNEVIIGDKSVCTQTIKNLSTSFLYNVQKPIQFTESNLLIPNLYFLLINFVLFSKKYIN